MAIQPDWAKQGFAEITGEITPRLIMSLAGSEKTGKTHFSLTAPAPISYLSLDFGDQGVIEKFHKLKKIYKKEFKIPSARMKDKSKMMEEAVDTWEDFKESYLFSLKTARTIIVDTETECWELVRLALLGKLGEVKPHHYGAVNREYKEVMIKAAFDGNANVILLQRLKKQYINDKYTGELEQTGYSGIPFDVQVNARTYIDAVGRFSVYIDNCRQNATLRGRSLVPVSQLTPLELADPAIFVGGGLTIPVGDLNFGELAKLVLPNSKSESWI